MTERSELIDSSAIFSDDGVYRYQLRRQWKRGPLINFIMLNPSIADAEKDDPTIRRCIRFAQDWEYSGLIVTNIYAYRTTDPDVLWMVDDPVGPDNDLHIEQASQNKTVIAAWGVNAKPEREREVSNLIAGVIVCLGKTKNGHPRHPLYVSGTTRPVVYRKGWMEL
jgi:hypothetical protein